MINSPTFIIFHGDITCRETFSPNPTSCDSTLTVLTLRLFRSTYARLVNLHSASSELISAAEEHEFDTTASQYPETSVDHEVCEKIKRWPNLERFRASTLHDITCCGSSGSMICNLTLIGRMGIDAKNR